VNIFGFELAAVIVRLRGSLLGLAPSPPESLRYRRNRQLGVHAHAG
jgi:hypothetical protein